VGLCGTARPTAHPAVVRGMMAGGKAQLVMDAMGGAANMRYVFARSVHDTLSATGKSADDLAAATNIAQSRIARILSIDARCVTLQEMAAIAAALERPLAALLSN